MNDKMTALENSVQHDILLNLLASTDDFDLKNFILDEIFDFKYGDLAIDFWNRCIDKYRAYQAMQALEQIRINAIKELI